MGQARLAGRSGRMSQARPAGWPAGADGSGEAGELAGEPGRLVLQAAEGDFQVGVLLLESQLLGREPDVPVVDLRVDGLDLALASENHRTDVGRLLGGHRLELVGEG